MVSQKPPNQPLDSLPEPCESSVDSDSSWLADVATSVRGFCMGVCDAVPGVSGGTAALILGIYDRLFIAICHVDRRLLAFLGRRQWGKAARHMDARFLLALVVGLGVGYVIMSLVIKYVMASDTLRALTLAAFTGMVLGSSIVIIKKIRPQRCDFLPCWFFGLIGCGLAAWIASQNIAATTGEVHLVYLFTCTVVAICAMVLPGISGAMLLLIFGVYYPVLEIPRNLLHLENVGVNLVRLVVVLAGCVVGLLTFGRVIKWLLNTFRAETMSAMLGLMIGSLIVLWPFQHRIEPVIEHHNHKPTYEIYLPEEFNLLIPGVVGCILFFAATVVLTDRFAMSIAKNRLQEIENRSKY